jgi:hypothetical protein
MKQGCGRKSYLVSASRARASMFSAKQVHGRSSLDFILWVVGLSAVSKVVVADIRNERSVRVWRLDDLTTQQAIMNERRLNLWLTRRLGFPVPPLAVCCEEVEAELLGLPLHLLELLFIVHVVETLAPIDFAGLGVQVDEHALEPVFEVAAVVDLSNPHSIWGGTVALVVVEDELDQRIDSASPSITVPYVEVELNGDADSCWLAFVTPLSLLVDVPLSYDLLVGPVSLIEPVRKCLEHRRVRAVAVGFVVNLALLVAVESIETWSSDCFKLTRRF